MSAPDLDAVLAQVRPGRAVRLYLTPPQKKALVDRDGLIARWVIRALLQARREATTDTRIYSFPLTTDCWAARSAGDAVLALAC